MRMSTGLPAEFHPAIREWFVERFGEPTEPQKRGWPLIGRGLNTLILAPTGSGKTLAAFLAGIDRVARDLEANSPCSPHFRGGPRGGSDDAPSSPHFRGGPRGGSPGVEILYISPLKALNYDIERNLSGPLREIQEKAVAIGRPLPEITTAVRTGDTPPDQRRKMAKKPPHILITTPESLHIILTSSARQMLQSVRYVIVDEIHALSPNKRGVFLSVLLERLEDLCENPPVRIGLSATQKPLEEVARFLGGFDQVGQPRPMHMVDAGVRRQVDLKVFATADDLRNPEDGSVWPSIYRTLLDMVRMHRSTIIFANTRRVVERLTMGINDLAGEELVLPHHGSVSAPIRRRTEAALKNGDLKAVVATGTLELGIDMGAVELVCQVESPKEVSRGLQRVGRAGHAYRGTSKGRIIPKTTSDLAEAVSVAAGMLEGDVEPIRVPRNCLDVLAQQIVAIAALDGAASEDVYHTVRRAYSFHELTAEAFNLTLQLVSGRYPAKAFRELRPRVSLDRVTGRISALPGSQRLVIANGGAIPDTGEYGVYLSEGNLKLGELDEEFVYESREGDTFSLGTNNWRILKIDADRVIVGHGAAHQARMPFWRGESVPRSAGTGRRMGRLLRTLADKGEDAFDWAIEALPVDRRAAGNLVSFVQSQTGATGDSGLPTDRRIVLESFQDEVGAPRLALLTVFGGRIHQALRIALSALIKQETGIQPETVAGDNGVLFRLPDADAPPPAYGLLRRLTPQFAYDLISEDLPNTALFGLRFRQNAARALLLPGAGPGKRTPLWLQRMKAKDLLQIAKSFDAFPIVVETYRECLQDYLDLDELRAVLEQVQSGEIELSVVERQIPSPFTSSMLLDFQMIYQYEWDEPKGTAKRHAAPTERRLVDELIGGKLGRELDEQAIADLDNRLQGSDRYSARTAEELYELVRRLGDIPEADAEARTADPEFIAALLEEGRLVRLSLPNARRSERLVASDYLDEYVRGDAEAILDRHFENRAVIAPDEIAADYGFEPELVCGMVARMAEAGDLVEIPPAPGSQAPRYTSPENLEVIYRRTLASQRAHAKMASSQDYSAFLLRWQHLHPDYQLRDQDGARAVLRQLEGLWLPYSVWEPDILARRVRGFREDFVSQLSLSGEFIWTGHSADPGKPGSIAFLAREGFSALHPLIQREPADAPTSPELDAVRDSLKKRGASFQIDIALATGLDGRIVQRALWELLWRGEVTHDYLKVVRAGKPAASPLILSTSKDGEGPGVRSSSSPLFSGEGQGVRSDRRQFYRTRSRIAKTFTHPPERNPGRWALLSSLAQHEVDEQESVEICARVLLERYGIVAKNLVQRPGEPELPWASLYRVYQRMELAGEIQRGYFVEGLSGAQFGLPEAVDELTGRYARRAEADAQPVLLNSCDPAYLFSTAGPFAPQDSASDFGRVTRLPSNYAVLLGGLPALTLELGSGTLGIRQDLGSVELASCIATLAHLLDSPWPVRPYRKVPLTRLGDVPLIGSPVETALRAAGFEPEGAGLVLRSSGSGLA